MKQGKAITKVVCVVPVFNEASILSLSIDLLIESFRNFRSADDWKIIIANNGSTDETEAVSLSLVARHPTQISYQCIPEKGRGNALKQVFSIDEAQTYCYIDCDLPCNLADFHRLIATIQAGVDLAVCKRVGKRPLRRRAMTKGLSLANRLIFGAHISDSQCAIKAFSSSVRNNIIPLCDQTGWFFDTEMVALTSAAGLTIVENQIHWIEQRFEGRKSKVRAWSDMKKGAQALWQIHRSRQRFAERLRSNLQQQTEPEDNPAN